MIRMNDVYWCVGAKLQGEWFEIKDIDDKKEMFDKVLKSYLIEKIYDLGITGVLDSSHKDEVSVVDLVEVLGTLIPEENHFDTLRHLTHCVINMASSIQGKLVICYEEENPECINNQVALFDSEGFWDSFATHKDDSCISDFEFAYDVFMNDFMTKRKVNKKSIFKSETN